jgi:hypothetical protein
MPSLATPAISDDELVDMLSLIKGADSVELKLTIPESSQRSTIEALGIDPIGAQVRLVHFYDTPDLTLEKAGVVVRARRVAQKGDDSVIKLRPVVPQELPAKLRAKPGFGVEVDAGPGGFVCSGRLKESLRRGKVQEAVNGDRAAQSLFTKGQRAFFAEHAPEGTGIDDLSILGPITVLKLKYTPPGYDRRLVVELWIYPDGSRLLELSTKCAPSEAFQVAAQSRVYLEERGIDLSGEQATKTKTALEFFAH